jgi:hypothetical protein
MTTFLLNKILLYVDRISEFAILLAYITGDHEDLIVIDGKNESIFSLQVWLLINLLGIVSKQENEKPLMAVTGQSGSGKTMLLAKFVLQIEVNRNEFYSLFLVLILFLGTNGR